MVKESDNMNIKEEHLKETKRVEYDLQTKEVANIIVQALIAERKRLGLTQQNIADDTGIKTPNITRFEACKYTPTLEVLTRYADALGKKLCIELIDK